MTALPNATSFVAITTPIFSLGEDLIQFIHSNVDQHLVREGMVLAITSKIVSLAEGRTVPREQVEKLELIKREADVYLGPMGYGSHLTITKGLLLASAGIDVSNSENGDFILYPVDPFTSAMQLWKTLREKWKIKDLGIILTDSRTTPLRLGVTGFALAYWGINGLRRCVGDKDLFGRELKMTSVNVVDGLAAAATLLMGEAAESRPLVVVHPGGDSHTVLFSDETSPDELCSTLEDDLYWRALRSGPIGGS
ncbi:MAG: coenzyme F420-0:L-glutamate ligase [Bdellovibrionaceae bacterium]|nr:coenzyme F420-0:L-glutamate ligase [Pseudobdellovibrionaceae bacterium]